MSSPPAASPFAQLPPGPCYAVIFSSQHSQDLTGYAKTADRMIELARQQPGFLGVESARGADGFGITVSYWRSEADIAAWRDHAEHALARQQGRQRWYAAFELRVARLERAHGAGPQQDLEPANS
ncbi:MAG: antibiotic biosynthesis monooxygenase [Burkholderiaceae bacterium]|jgi:heme-degrading monooxygenase HmoA|nr:antibiotic biosynthesis monooxygenase [Burkholderiaceae bacterium]